MGLAMTRKMLSASFKNENNRESRKDQLCTEWPKAMPRSALEDQIDLARFTKANVPLLKTNERRDLDQQLLEFCLGPSCGKRQARKQAKHLLLCFGSLAEVVGTSFTKLTTRGGLTPETANTVKMLQLFIERTLRSDVIDRPLLSTYRQLIDYCHTAMAFEERELVRLIFLTVRYHVMDDIVYSRGTIAHCPAYAQEIVREALARCAPCLMMVHNHPSGDATPSQADIEMSRSVMAACSAVGLTFVDSIIVAREGDFSMRRAELLTPGEHKAGTLP